MNRHTPGPWRVSNFDARIIGPIRTLRSQGNDVPQLLAVARVFERTNESDANALLIAAAPDLLEACKLVLNCSSSTNVVAAIESAIAKAEGRS